MLQNITDRDFFIVSNLISQLLAKNKYLPFFIQQIKKAIEFCKQMVYVSLLENGFQGYC